MFYLSGYVNFCKMKMNAKIDIIPGRTFRKFWATQSVYLRFQTPQKTVYPRIWRLWSDEIFGQV